MRTIKTYFKGAPFYNAFLRPYPVKVGDYVRFSRISLHKLKGAPLYCVPFSRYATNNIWFTQQGVGCIRMLIGAVKTHTLGVPMVGPRNDPGVACETQFAIVMHGG